MPAALRVCIVWPLSASAVLLFGLALIAYLLHIHALPTVALVLAVTLPCSLGIEFVRRFALAELDVRSAALLDAGVTGIQLFLLVLLAQISWLNAPIALLSGCHCQSNAGDCLVDPL